MAVYNEYNYFNVLAQGYVYAKMATLCKAACGKDLAGKARDRRLLGWVEYDALVTLSCPSLSTGQVLAKSPSYVCKSCHSVLTKYGRIAKEIADMQQRLKGTFGLHYSLR